MNRKNEEKAEVRFSAYVAGVSGVLGTPTGLARCVIIAPG